MWVNAGSTGRCGNPSEVLIPLESSGRLVGRRMPAPNCAGPFGEDVSKDGSAEESCAQIHPQALHSQGLVSSPIHRYTLRQPKDFQKNPSSPSVSQSVLEKTQFITHTTVLKSTVLILWSRCRSGVLQWTAPLNSSPYLPAPSPSHLLGSLT